MEILILWLAFSVLAAVIAEKRGNSGVGAFFLSVILSPLIGIIWACACTANKTVLEKRAIGSGAMKQCPYCAEPIRSGASLCPHCHQTVGQPRMSSDPLDSQPRVGVNVKYLVKRNGEELGEMSPALIRRKVKAGELDLVDDLYFDSAARAWNPIGELVDV